MLYLTDAVDCVSEVGPTDSSVSASPSVCAADVTDTSTDT